MSVRSHPGDPRPDTDGPVLWDWAAPRRPCGLAKFLIARLVEDRAVAQEALDRASVYGDREVTWKWLRAASGSTMWEPTNHTPTRVLAEYAAKIQIVGLHARANDTENCAECGDYEDSPVPVPCETLRWLALPYADHSDYQDDWRP